MERNKYFYILLLLVLCLHGCAAEPAHEPEVLRDLAYSEDMEEHQYTVYISENGEMVPYLVLADNYGGNCLLLRKYVLDAPGIFNSDVRSPGYYENSLIDQMLNQDFRETLSEQIDAYMVTSDVIITSEESLLGGEEAVFSIPREVFLLSATEVCSLGFRTTAREGEVLDYFSSNARRIAETADGKVSSWWLRTPDMWYDDVVCGVDINGVVGIGGVGAFGDEEAYTNGVRPAFCLKPDAPICWKDGAYFLPSDDNANP